MKELKSNSCYSASPQTEHPHNPCHTTDKIPINIPQFTVNIPLETDEHLCSLTEDNKIIIEREKSNPLKIMMDKRTLLKSEPAPIAVVPPSTPVVPDNLCSNVDIDEMDEIDDIDDMDDVDDVDDPLIDIHDHMHRDISNSSYTTYSNDDRSTNNTYYYGQGALPNRAPPVNPYIDSINDKLHVPNITNTVPANLAAPTNDFVMPISESNRPPYNYGNVVDRPPYPSTNQPPTSPSGIPHFPSDNRSRCDCYPTANVNASDHNYPGCYVVDKKIAPEHLEASPVYEYHHEYHPDANYYHQRNHSLSPNAPSTNHSYQKPQYNNYNQQNNSPYVKKHIPVETIKTAPPKDDTYDTDSADTFVEQIAKIYITERPTPRDQEKTKPCNCQKTGCLKLYCECFARGESCLNCSCKCCLNTPNDFEHWLKASNLVKSRRKTLLAMSPKNSSGNKLRRGCNCRRSLCLKKYCECYDKKIPCNKYCRCIDCCNGMDSQHVRKAQKASNNDSHNATIPSSGESTSYRNASYTDPSKVVFYSDVQSSESEATVRYDHFNDRIHRHATAAQYHNGPRRVPVIQLHQHHEAHPKHYAPRLHSSQSSNDLVNRAGSRPYRKLPHIHPYTKSNSTPNLLTVYSTHNASIRSRGPEFSSSSKINDRSYNSGGINNKQMMNQYLSLIARNPDRNE